MIQKTETSELKRLINEYLHRAFIDRNRNIYEEMSKGIQAGQSISSLCANLAVKYGIASTRIRALDKGYTQHLERVARLKKLEGDRA